MQGILSGFSSGNLVDQGSKWPAASPFPRKAAGPRYQYQSLGERLEIRIVVLHASNPRTDKGLSIDIEHQLLDDGAAAFEALSYNWGVGSTRHTLECNEHSLSVTTNLRDALLALRSPTEPRRLWIDAICIDQANESEKQAQIALMRQIYSRAECTLVWLGSEADDSAVAVDYFNHMEQRLLQSVRDHVDVGRPVFSAAELIGEIHKSYGRSMTTLFPGFDPDRTLRAIALFMARPWFRRTWVIQEFIVSQDIKMFCGGRKVTYAFAIPAFMYSFEQARIHWSQHVPPDKKEHMFRGIQQMLEIQEQRNQAAAADKDGHRLALLVSLLKKYRYSESTLPEDKVLSLLGLASDYGTFDKVDYDTEKQKPLAARLGDSHVFADLFALPKAELYLTVAQRLVAHGRGADVLGQASRSSRTTTPDMPSWVPDWSEMPESTDVGDMISTTGWFFKAGGEKRRGRTSATYKTVAPEWPHDAGHGAYVSPEADANTSPEAGAATSKAKTVLLVEGAPVQRVMVVGSWDPQRIPGVRNLSTFLTALAALQRMDKVWPAGLDPPYPTGESLLDVQTAVLSAGQQRSARTSGNGHANGEGLGDLFGGGAVDDGPSPLGREFGWDILADLEIDALPPLPPDDADAEIVEIFREIARDTPDVARNFARATAGRVAFAAYSTDDQAAADGGSQQLPRMWMGLGPRGMARDDVVCLVRRAQAPYVLRPVGGGSGGGGGGSGGGSSSSTNRYTLVGDCYVHGIMQGELVDGGVPAGSTAEALAWQEIAIE